MSVPSREQPLGCRCPRPCCVFRGLCIRLRSLDPPLVFSHRHVSFMLTDILKNINTLLRMIIGLFRDSVWTSCLVFEFTWLTILWILWLIEGIPIVLYWYDLDNKAFQAIGVLSLVIWAMRTSHNSCGCVGRAHLNPYSFRIHHHPPNVRLQCRKSWTESLGDRREASSLDKLPCTLRKA